MRSLSKTYIFEPIDRLMGVKEALSDPDLVKNFAVPFPLYEHFMQNFRGFKYPLSKFVIEATKNKTIVPILMAESNVKTLKGLDRFPISVPCFRLADNVTYANISPRASYLWDKNGNPIFLKITDREFYSFMQSALIFRIFGLYDAKISSNLQLVKSLAEIYTILLSKCIDKTYPIAADRSDLAGVQYLCAKFFLDYCMEIPGERADTIIGKIRTIDKSMVMNSLGGTESIPTIESVDQFVELLKDKFPYLRKESVTFKTLVTQFTSMYGSNAVFALEQPFAFAHMIFMSNMRIGMYNDRVIDNVGGKYVEDLEKMLAEFVSTLPSI